MKQIKQAFSAALTAFEIYLKVGFLELSLLVLIGIVSGLGPLAIVAIIDQISQNLGNAQMWLLLGIVIYFMMQLVEPLHSMLSSRIADKTSKIIPVNLAQAFHKMNSLDTIDKTAYQDDINRVNRGATSEPLSFLMTVIGIIKFSITVISLYLYFVSINFYFATIMIVMISPMSYVYWKVQNIVWHEQGETGKHIRKMNYYFTSMLSRDAFKENKLFTTLSNFISLYQIEFKKFFKLREIGRKRQFKYIGFGLLLVLVGMSVLMLNFSMFNMDIENRMPTILTIMLQFISALTYLCFTFSNINYSSSYFNSYQSILTNVVDVDETKATSDSKNVIELNDFCLFIDDKQILKNINLSIAKGEKVAVVGRNGAGKTTLMHGLLGLHSNCTGAARVYGSDVNVGNHLQKVSAVFQDYSRYFTTINNNVTLGGILKPETEENILYKNTDSFSDPDKKLGRYYDGVDLSTGEWQKLAILRAKNKDADLIFYDEPTAAIDPEAENEILKSMVEDEGGKTVFVITHRLSILKYVDRVLFLKNGELILNGSHHELMESSEDYQNFYQTQSKHYEHKKADEL